MSQLFIGSGSVRLQLFSITNNIGCTSPCWTSISLSYISSSRLPHNGPCKSYLNLILMLIPLYNIVFLICVNTLFLVGHYKRVKICIHSALCGVCVFIRTFVQSILSIKNQLCIEIRGSHQKKEEMLMLSSLSFFKKSRILFLRIKLKNQFI